MFLQSGGYGTEDYDSCGWSTARRLGSAKFEPEVLPLKQDPAKRRGQLETAWLLSIENSPDDVSVHSMWPAGPCTARHPSCLRGR